MRNSLNKVSCDELILMLKPESYYSKNLSFFFFLEDIDVFVPL